METLRVMEYRTCGQTEKYLFRSEGLIRLSELKFQYQKMHDLGNLWPPVSTEQKKATDVGNAEESQKLTKIGKEPTKHVTIRVPGEVIRSYKRWAEVSGKSWRQLMRDAVVEAKR